jgi:hypothetical protein
MTLTPAVNGALLRVRHGMSNGSEFITAAGECKVLFYCFSNSKSETKELNAKPPRCQGFDLSSPESAGMPIYATASQKSPCDFATWR